MMVFFAACLPAVLLMCGLAVDVSLLQLKMLQMQTAADAGAIAAEMEAERGTENWVAEGKDDAAVNGFTDGVNGATVSVSNQPTYGAYSTRYDAMQVTITQTVNTIFMGALSGGQLTLTVQATSQMTPCLVLTGNGTLQANRIEVKNNGKIDGISCPAYANQQFELLSGATEIHMEAINVSGPSSDSTVDSSAIATPTYNVQAMSDPLASVTLPTFSSCNHTSYTLSSGSATLSPGTYCKGITLTNSTVTLNPGLYIITGGSTWSNATVTGTGVTLFFTSGGGGSDGKFIVENSSTVTMSAPTSSSNGSIPAIVVATDRTWTPTSNQDVALMDSTVTGDGIWYLPATGLYIDDCGTVEGTNYWGVDADNLWVGQGNLRPSNNYSFVTTGNPMRSQGVLIQ